jgi:protocatechuate 3,4-dioxygenase beta subunit
MAGGTVTGRVTDASGANLPNTRIELENLDTGQRLTMVTDESGSYTFNNVPAGR